MRTLVLILAVGISVCGAQIIVDGVCDTTLQPLANFDVASYLGLWYEIAKTPTGFQFGECATATYTLADDGTVDVYNTEVINNFPDNINGSARLASTDGSAALLVTFDIPGVGVVESNYWVLNTDYQTYAIVYNCENLANGQRSISLWKLSRSPTVTALVNAFMDNFINNNINGISATDLRETDQSDTACYLLPFLGPNEPVILDGQCDTTIPVVQNFDVASYLGLWNSISSYYSENQLGTCGNAMYSLADDGTVAVLNTEVINQALDTIAGTARLDSTDGSARLLVTFPTPDGGTIDLNYWVLATDYVSHSLVYSCQNLNNNQFRVWSWKLSRSKELSTESSAAIDAVVNQVLVLNDAYYTDIDQSDEACFYYPEANSEPVFFRGQCDESIATVQNFDAVAYTGQWYEIEGYPSIWQYGTCNSAQYTLTPEGTVAVYNTQVVNQTLDEINGFATVASTDGSAKLNVFFPIEGSNELASLSYWVLATDYTSYSLVYSCQNIDEDQRAVWSWKLSRTRQLTAAANTAMTQTINTVPVLDQRYFETKDQSEEGCFYYPQPLASEPVVFPGLCNESIPVVTNFDATRYAGQWYEISGYPSQFQQGSCNTALYTLTPQGTVDVYNTQVLNNRLDVINGTAVLATTDGSAKLTVTFPVAGTTLTVDTPYWVLDTDYDSYSLVYTCVNLSPETRGVWSWKLSRTRDLSPQANTAINAIVSTIDVLDEQYYFEKDQSEDGCFYLPFLEPGEPIVIPGQCNLSIPVQQNFDPTRYTGLWHEIEGYPSVFQDGTCNNALYTLTPEGTVDVYNTQVVNQSLDDIRGVAVLASTDGSGRLSVTFPIAGTDQFQSLEYWILSTDYDSYSFVYSCANINAEQRQVWSWKLSRTKQLTVEAQQIINNIVSSVNVLDPEYYMTRDQSDDACFYYPEANSEPVFFRGQCDESIATVQNFDAVAYTGQWYEIEGYPSIWQYGTCNSAQYTLTPEGTVDVYNTQVVNQTLDEIYGFATVASTDGSAKLDVFFPIEGSNELASLSYWVLATDYTSYSLVYSCQNIDEDQRAVWSWKLSRTRQLTAAANTAMTQTINTVPVLDQRYFETKDQSEEGCFYYPQPLASEPVVFPGLCNESIPVVTNFDATRYAGQWYEISGYPSQFQQGSCNTALYTLTPQGTVDVYNTQVLNNRLDVINGTAVLATTDGSAKLTVTFPVAGTTLTVDTPYWVLDTDYDSYSLVYTCVNLSPETRGVWSWKLSRTRDLSPQANTAINAIVSTIDVLDEQYYFEKDQSEDGCFYLPFLDPGEPIVIPGQCNLSIPVQQNFDPTRYTGLWHEIEGYPSVFQDGTCNNALYTLTPEGTVDVYNTQVVNQTLDDIRGVAVLASTDGSGRLSVTFPIAGTDQFQSLEYWILSTDYDSYSFVYSCANINAEQRQVWSWKLSRTKQLTVEAQQIINNIVSSVNVLDPEYYMTRDQSDDACFYYPEANSEPVFFRGQCDESIATVQNFDAVAYTGQWYEIEGYPSIWQYGTCNSAQYTLTPEGTVDVYNTQVVNQTLDEIYGFATVASTDGSAKLDVFFPIEGSNELASLSYWVLATDYTSYSLVYSCQNIDEDQRAVWSWKLSRTRQLTAAANTAMTQTINTVPVLDQRYFETKDQSEEGCFYYPQPLASEPVVFPGLCNESIPVVTNFDATRYAGQWYEISGYPSQFQQGSCNTALYTLTPQGTVDVYNTQVLNNRLDVINGTAVLATTDGSAKLTVTFPVAGTTQTVDTPYWVLDTDYDTYSLVYTCVNLSPETRGVWSWKLSRSKELTPQANTAINAIVETIDVLDEQYYFVKDQSDDGCFYLPFLEPGETVIMPGQCDLNIPVQQNFDPTRYTGLWHEIEGYPSVFQDGTCNNALYTLTPEGTVDVYNTQVVNQALDDIRGVAVLASTDGSGRLSVTFPIAGTDQFQSLEYWILSTDYDSYSFVYSCANVDSDRRQVWSWKLSRSKQLSLEAQQIINTIMDSINVLEAEYFAARDQSDEACFYFPEPNGQPVSFRGQCDESITVVQNFNVEAYTGFWYQVEAYPQSFQQEASCSNAQYTLNIAGFVDVVNTQVVNQQLDTITAMATLATTDGSAKLDVTFPIAGTDQFITTDYWVLATDYNNYALVYSCMNTGEDSRRVTSWKLSRQPTLSAASEAAISAAMEPVQVLRQDYYEVTGQTEEDCFYYADNNGGPVLFEGQCDNDDAVTVVTNFDAARYLGTWHEIARFPSPSQIGECAKAQYSLSDSGEVDVYNTIVLGERLLVINGTATPTYDDGRGILTVTFPNPVEGGVLLADTLTYYILDTDYDNFALVYACYNVDATTKQVFSWKLSRSRSGLTEEANQRIDAIVSDKVDLFEGYYDYIDQTDDGCFYYPEFDLNPETGGFTSAIILPGPCSTTVSGIPNFDPTRYTGRWYEMARYPEGFETGECARAQYFLTPEGTVDVVNTIVFNQELETVLGTASLASNDGTGQLLVTFPVFGTNEFRDANYYVLATDYDNYALVYSCRNLEDGNRQVSSWKLSRERTWNNQYDAILNPVIEQTQGLLEDYYIPTDQSDEACFYVPEFNSDEAVVFPGQCQDDIPVVQDFDIERYLGWWHEMEHFPSGSNLGDCLSTEYQVVDGQYVAVDTSVSGIAADVTTSQLQVSADAPGRLRKVLENGEVIDYWVLATDYETYSLLYSCQNIDDETRLVWSAKHSKIKLLTLGAEMAFAAVIAQMSVLDSSFYVPVNQDADSCFHYPQLAADATQVILPGQCDDNIPAVQNFDPVAYTGVWYQIERYPQVWEFGSCIGARYTLDEQTGVITLVNWQVVDGELVDIVGTAVVSSDDGSAKVTATLPVEGTDETTSLDLYVLATDYVSYALAYTCENINAFQRHVGVWKVSRTRTMPAEGTAAINTIIAQRPELFEGYFIQTEQDEDCPEPSSAYRIAGSSAILILMFSVIHLVLPVFN